MKYAWILLLSLAIAGNAAQFAPRAVSERRISIEKTPSLTLLREGETQFDLVVPSKANRAVREAGRELSKILSDISGQEVKPIAAASNRPALILGDVELARPNGIEPDKIDRDGFAIRTIGNKVLLIGPDALDPAFGQGTLFAVYDFLERFADCRFYFPGKIGTLIPRKKAWSIPSIDILDRPDNQYRRIFWREYGKPRLPAWYDSSAADRAAALHQGRLRLSTMNLPNCHGLAYLGLVERFAKTHPDYFALREDGTRHDGSRINAPSDRAGHICFSNPRLKEEIYQDAKAVLTGQSARSRGVVLPDGSSRWAMHKTPFFNLMPNDSMFRCRCDGCRPHFDQGKESGGQFVWNWKLDIVKRLKAEKIPGYVTMMAYDLCQTPPSEPLPDNTVLQLAVNGPWDDAIPEKQKQSDRLISDWYAKTGGKIYLWNYPTKFCLKNIPLIPNHTPEAVGRYYAQRANRIFGVFFEAESDYWLYGHLNFLMFSKVMWDTRCDRDALLEEYYSRMFGPAAKPMKEFFQTLERHWLNDFYANVIDTPEGPVGTPPTDYEIWTKIYRPEEIKRIAGLFARSEKLAAADPEALKRIRFMREQMWGPMEHGSREYFRKAADVEKWSAPLPRLNCAAPVIDGKPNDAAWRDASEITLVPLGKEEAEVLTRVKMIRDDANFYFLFDCAEPELEKMRVIERKNDDPMLWSDNAVEIYLAPAGTRQEYRQFIINSEGKISDLLVVPSELKTDWKWNGKAEAAATRLPGRGWCAEVKIPRASLPPEAQDGRIAANFTRHRVLNGRNVHPYYAWNIYGRTFGDLATFGVLTPCAPSCNLFPDGDFRRAGSGGKPFPGEWFDWGGRLQRDTAVFRTAGASIRLSGKHGNLVHRTPFIKPSTRYRLSFFLRLDKVVPHEKNAGFYVRIDDGNKTVRYFPRQAYIGTIPWMRLEYEYQTSEAPGAAYIHFALRKSDGTAWVDSAELIELP